MGNAQINVQDSLALVDIYNATNGSNWNNSTNWLIGKAKTWYGVDVDTIANRVIQLDLDNNNLTGYIPSSIGNLTLINEIHIYNNNLTGNIPQTIGRLTHLNWIEAQNNQLSGILTDSICRLTNITAIHIGNNNFTGKVPDSLNQLPHLNTFGINNNQFDRLPDFSAITNAWIADYEVENNHFTFGDIEPNMLLGSFVCSFCLQYYAPQFDSINDLIDTTIQENSVFEMHCNIGGQHNIYQWTKDTVAIPLATDSVLVINNVALSDSGVYSCRVTNSVVQGLTYHRRPITVHVDKFTEAINNFEQENCLGLFPNPATHTLYIENAPPNATLSITNLLGEEVLRWEATEKQFAVDISGLRKGVYFVRLEAKEGVVVRKFVKE